MPFFIKKLLHFWRDLIESCSQHILFFPITILRFKTFHRKAVTKVKNQVFPMVCSSKCKQIQVKNVSCVPWCSPKRKISTPKWERRRKIEFLWFPSKNQPYLHSKLVYEANSRISIRTFYFFDEKKNHNLCNVWLQPHSSKIKQNELFSLNLPLIFDSEMGTSTKKWVFVILIQKPALSA